MARDGGASVRYAMVAIDHLTKIAEVIPIENRQPIEQTTNRTVERFIRTFKDNLYRRLDGLSQNKSEWVKHVKSIVTNYSNTEHNAAKTKPLDAVKKENHLWVNLHLQNNATKNRIHPKLNEGDMVRVNILISKFAKGYEPNWSRERYKVVGIKGNQYLVPGKNKDKLYLGHELLKV